MNSQVYGVPFGTDASKIALLDIPTIVFGPGSINQAHTKDEHIKVSEIVKAAKIYKDLILHFHEYF
ncbi:M20/M25/M40 family metallo-hydrolase [Ferdinandcohnia sp. SAFN-114]|uniref:M20/M25/M40 family metallo-hydrolase n=1 Tax=Ferdinandcohnia sp. SAFN-114 TaxID=3387275 RepID=UPI003F7F22F8